MKKEEYKTAGLVLKTFQKENPGLESFSFMYYTQWLAGKMTYGDEKTYNL